MADIHPDVRILLNGLSASALSRLAQSAIVEINRKDFRRSDFQTDAVSERARRRQQRDQLRLQGEIQLGIVDRAIREELELELVLTRGLQQMSERWGIRDVIVLPTVVDRVDGTVQGDNLLGIDRAKSIQTFLAVWSEVVAECRVRLGVG